MMDRYKKQNLGGAQKVMGSAKRTLWSKEIKNDLRIGEPV